MLRASKTRPLTGTKMLPPHRTLNTAVEIMVYFKLATSYKATPTGMIATFVRYNNSAAAGTIPKTTSNTALAGKLIPAIHKIPNPKALISACLNRILLYTLFIFCPKASRKLPTTFSPSFSPYRLNAHWLK